MRPASAADARDQLGVQVIDADAHTVELVPMLADHFRDQGLQPPSGEIETLGAYVTTLFGGRGSWEDVGVDERLARRLARSPWWGFPWSNTVDLATASLPQFLYERLDEFGLDVCIVYPSIGLLFATVEREDQRRAACRALNRYHREVFAGLEDRLLPVAVVSTHSPQEAVEELEDALALGFRAIVIPSYVRRPVPDAPTTTWVDSYGLDSAYDYDPFWKRCVERGVAVGTHSGTMGWDSRRSISNYMYNHIGHLAAAGEVCCKSLFFGGVTRRFPDLHVAFLEGGVSWACSLYADLVGHWDKRQPHRLRQNYNPDRLDRDQFPRSWIGMADSIVLIHPTSPGPGGPSNTSTSLMTNGPHAVSDHSTTSPPDSSRTSSSAARQTTPSCHSPSTPGSTQIASNCRPCSDRTSVIGTSLL